MRKTKPGSSGWSTLKQQGSVWHRLLVSEVGSLGVLALLLISFSGLQLSAQSPQFNAGAFPRAQMPDGGSPLTGDTGNVDMEAKRVQALNAARQKSLVSDTNKLVKLTAELNAQINNTHPASLTESQLRMVAEIEKLAHNIREKMCTPVTGLPRIGLPGPSLIPPPLQ